MAKHSGIFLIEDKALDRRASAGPFLKALNWCHGCQIERRQAAGANDLLHYVEEWASGS